MNEFLITTLAHNGLAIIATDTLYGIVGKATEKEVVEHIYEVKGRDENKPFIILVPSIATLETFGVLLTDNDREKISQWWPGPVTVILPVAPAYQEALSYLHRGTNELAFRMPGKPSLIELLQHTGPLVAPSANPQGKEPAHTMAEAKEYFGDAIAYYEDEGEVHGLPSTIVRLQNGEITVIRQGAISVV